ncbi:hypothetical protein E4U52_004214, partial [Claviceps spartinae]
NLQSNPHFHGQKGYKTRLSRRRDHAMKHAASGPMTDDDPSKLSPHLDDSHGKKTALSIPSTAGDEPTQREPDKHKQAQPPFSPQSSCSGSDLPPKPTAAHRLAG